jgi:lipopolysaccharide/colanic/teichoic acid biosynthesis glycosyltransferase
VNRLVAAVALVVTSPILLAAMLAIRIESAGSPIYRQRRVGRGGESFEMYKLRTMVADAEFMGDGLAVNRGDPRITRVGAFLRRFSIDELPNLLNIVRGEMAFVGPRPTIQAQVDQYTEHQLRRLEVKPGLTGWAQINGRASLPWSERIELDVWYVDNKGPLLDLKIIVKTIRMLLFGHGIYKGGTGGWTGPTAT